MNISGPFRWFKKQPVTIRGAVIGGLFLLAAAALATILPRAFSGDSALRLVDFSVDDTRRIPILDIKVRNVGDRIGFLKRAVVHVERMWGLRPFAYFDFEPVRWVYDLKLPDRPVPYEVELDLSQSVEPDAVDRFAISLTHGHYGHVFYLVWLELVYDEDDKRLVTHRVAFGAGPVGNQRGMMFLPSEEFRRAMAINRRIAREIDALDVPKGMGLRAVLVTIWNMPTELPPELVFP